jgi:hypothetical protein
MLAFTKEVEGGGCKLALSSYLSATDDRTPVQRVLWSSSTSTSGDGADADTHDARVTAILPLSLSEILLGFGSLLPPPFTPS